MIDHIPVYNPKPEIEYLWPEIEVAVERVLKEGRFIMGPDVITFEQAAAEYLGVSHAVALNSGTDALVLGLRAAGVQSGDEVITTTFSFFATAEAIGNVGATPVFVDIDPKTYNIAVDQIEAQLTNRTRALIPVHLYGGSAEMDSIMDLAEKYDLVVIEDVAQAFGGRYKNKKLGTIGHVGAFSFFPTKNLGAYGDAGLLITDDDEIAEVVKMLRVHGAQKKYDNEILGYNSRMDTIQAALLKIKLDHIDDFIEKRRRVGSKYNQLLEGIDGIQLPAEVEGTYHVFNYYTIRVDDGRRDEVKTKLAEAGIGTMIYYPKPLHQLKLYQDLNLRLPEAELAAKEVLSLPIWPHIKTESIERVANTLREILR